MGDNDATVVSPEVNTTVAEKPRPRERSRTQKILFICEIGCAIGIPDAVSRLDHYVEARCGKGDLLVRCPEPGCKHSINGPEASIDAIIGAFLLHYTMKHASDAFEKHAAGYSMDYVCGLAFPNRKTMYCHYLGGIASRGKLFNRTAVAGHRDKVLRQFVAQENIVINS